MKLHSTTIEKSQLDGTGDFSPLGVLVEDIQCERVDLTSQVWYGNGFYKKKPSEISARWTRDNASVLVPFDRNLATNEYSITVHAPLTPSRSSVCVELSLGDEAKSETLRAGQVKQFSFTLSESAVNRRFIWLVQNAGNVVFIDGYGRDRGSIVLRSYGETKEFYEPDSAYFQTPTELLAFCGASCLIKRKVIEAVGFFDPRYYMYYEDLDLSLRAWLAGWDIWYEPRSIVYHRHKASTNAVKGAFMLYQVEKNHLYFLLTYFPWQIVGIEFMLLCLRWLLTYLQMLIYVFRNNLPTFELLQQRHLARKDAIADCVKNVWYFVQKRRRMHYIRPGSRTLLFAKMY